MGVSNNTYLEVAMGDDYLDDQSDVPQGYIFDGDTLVLEDEVSYDRDEYLD